MLDGFDAKESIEDTATKWKSCCIRYDAPDAEAASDVIPERFDADDREPSPECELNRSIAGADIKHARRSWCESSENMPPADALKIARGDERVRSIDQGKILRFQSIIVCAAGEIGVEQRISKAGKETAKELSWANHKIRNSNLPLLKFRGQGGRPCPRRIGAGSLSPPPW